MRFFCFVLTVAVVAAPACSSSDDCPPGQINDGTSCRRPGAGGLVGGGNAVCGPQVVINEVLYNPEGNEGDVTTSFIELAGPPDTPIEDWNIRRVKRSGKDGADIILKGSIGPSGYFVIGEGELLDGGVAPDMVDPAADGQNSNYAFVLQCNGQDVDAVAYGDWSREPPEEGEEPEETDEDPFPGEESPASGAAEGLSLARCPDSGDTNNNGRDFGATTPSPGAASIDCPAPPPECAPGARPPLGGGADLVFNELAAKSVPFQVGEDSLRSEFIEIANISGDPLDLGDHELLWNPSEEQDFTKSRLIPAGTCVPADGALVVWGGDAPPPSGEDVLVLTAASLTIRDSGGEIRLVGPAAAGSQVIESLCYNEEGCPATQPSNVSITRDPDSDPNAPWVRHDAASHSAGAVASPGTCQNSDAFSTGCTRMPEPPDVEPDPACEEIAPTGLMINEVGFDPPEGGWEFVELFNPSADPAPVASLTVSDAVSVKYTFADDAAPIAGGGVLVVMALSAADCPLADASPFDAGVPYVCAGSLGLNNGGDTVTLALGDPTEDPPADPAPTIIDQIIYGEPPTDCLHGFESDTSYTRAPDGGAGWRPHLSANPALAQSPGTRVDGSRF